jgi:hypothetical protein
MTFLCKRCDLFVSGENAVLHLTENHANAGEDMRNQAQWFQESPRPELKKCVRVQVAAGEFDTSSDGAAIDFSAPFLTWDEL